MSDYPIANAWFEKMMGQIPNYEKACGVGAKQFGGFYKAAKANSQ